MDSVHWIHWPQLALPTSTWSQIHQPAFLTSLVPLYSLVNQKCQPNISGLNRYHVGDDLSKRWTSIGYRMLSGNANVFLTLVAKTAKCQTNWKKESSFSESCFFALDGDCWQTSSTAVLDDEGGGVVGAWRRMRWRWRLGWTTDRNLRKREWQLQRIDIVAVR